MNYKHREDIYWIHLIIPSGILSPITKYLKLSQKEGLNYNKNIINSFVD